MHTTQGSRYNLPLFLMGKLVSQLGTHIYNFGISLFVLKTTGSPLLFSLNLVLAMAPQILFAPVFGVLADRLPKKKLVVGMDLLSGLTLFVAAFALTHGGMPLVTIYVSTFVLSLCNTLFGVAMSASIVELFDKRDLLKVGGYKGTVDSSAMILGPVLGGFVFALINFPVFMLINGVSFVLSACSECFLQFKASSHAAERQEESFKSAFSAGLRYLKSRPDLMRLLGFFMIVNFFAAATEVLIPFILVDTLALPAESIGTIEAAFAVGMLVMSVVLSQFKPTIALHRLLGAGIIAIGLLVALFSLPLVAFPAAIAATVFYYIALNFMVGMAIIGINVPIGAMLQQTIAPEFMGRISGLLNTGVMLIIPLSQVLTGLSLQAINPVDISLLSGLALIAAGILVSTDRRIRTSLAENAAETE